MSISKPITGIFIIFGFLAQAANATKVLAVLEIVPKDEVEEISVNEVRHLTDELRKQATKVLPKQGFSILTRDNILALIPPDEKEAECLAESCAVDIGRVIGAEYVTQGSIGKFGKKFSISVELYETMGGRLLSSIVMESEDIDGLLEVIRKEGAALFEEIKADMSPLSQNQNSQNLGNLQNNSGEASPLSNPQTPIPIPQTQKSSVPTWVAIALDVIGAGLLIYGFTQNSKINDLQKDYEAYGEGSQQADIKANKKKTEDAKSLRNVMYISGGVALTLGIGVHIWF